ncbi:MAG: U32 family peptidase, partial [Acholeplasmataceae bacterium]|nr:U32 family peptidase [Acholeplasmataceae bacterium]
SNFSLSEIKEAADFAHQLGKKLYVTANIIPHDENYEGLIEYLKGLEEANIDAIIVASPYIVNMAKKHTNLEVHISTQQSVLNHYAVKYFEDIGASRVVLGRELNVDEIKTIVEKSQAEIEVFIHGGMCASYSGRCTLSNTFTLRDANRGGCAHSCRWNYDLFDGNEKISDETLFSMSSKDLQSLRFIPSLIDAGVHSLKIEGRMKSVHYIATVVWVYRMLIDEYIATGKISDFDYYENEISKAENRLTKEGFLGEFPNKNYQLYNNRSEIPTKTFVGIVLGPFNDYIKVEQRNHFRPEDTLEVFGPGKKPRTFKVESIYDTEMNLLDAARHPRQEVLIKIPFKVEPYDLIRKAND